MFVSSIVMDNAPNRNGRRYTTAALIGAAKEAFGKKLYTNIAPQSKPLSENEIGEIINAFVENIGCDEPPVDSKDIACLRVTCAVDTSKSGWDMVLEPFVMVPDGEATFDSNGVINDFTLFCVALAPGELGAFVTPGKIEIANEVEIDPMTNITR